MFVNNFLTAANISSDAAFLKSTEGSYFAEAENAEKFHGWESEEGKRNEDGPFAGQNDKLLCRA